VNVRAKVGVLRKVQQDDDDDVQGRNGHRLGLVKAVEQRQQDAVEVAAGQECVQKLGRRLHERVEENDRLRHAGTDALPKRRDQVVERKFGCARGGHAGAAAAATGVVVAGVRYTRQGEAKLVGIMGGGATVVVQQHEEQKDAPFCEGRNLGFLRKQVFYGRQASRRLAVDETRAREYT
jgi:hypothetical protein